VGATARPPGRLESIRRVDWRFLLPEAAFDRVVVMEPTDDPLLDALELVAPGVARAGPAGQPKRPGLVVAIGPDDRGLRAALDRVPGGGWIYVGSGHGRAGRRASLRQVARAADEGGLVEIRRSWHWPDEPSALEIVPLDDARAIRLVLDRRRSGRAARLKARFAMLARRIGLLDAIVPGWSVVARRPNGGVPAGGRGTTPLDPIRASLPDGAESGVVLLTPRFRASRHVVGLVLRSDGDGLAAVVKVPRLPEDDGGIRREGAALASAAAAGVPGVPAMMALHGAPRPMLIESALDGVVIGSRDIRARPSELLDEVEAWTRALAGTPDARRVPFRALFAPALQRIASEVGVGGLAPEAVASAVNHERDPQDLARLVTRTAAILKTVGDGELPVVIEHGDLAPPNLLRLRGGGLGAVDWEVADLHGLPLGDLLFFAAFVTSAVDDSAVDGRTSPATAPAESAVARQAAFLDIDAALVPAIALAMWARWADRQLTRFTDASTPLGERLPARHVRSWAAAAARLDTDR
jgi:aminoglycoside phosphotransferase